MQRLLNESTRESNSVGSVSNLPLMDDQCVPNFSSPLDERVRSADVLCGRGKVAFSHAGNMRFREAIEDSVDKYTASNSKYQRAMIVQSVIDRVQSFGGRFVRKDFHRNQWIELSASQSREKVHHALRDTAKNSCRKRHCSREEFDIYSSAISSVNSLSTSETSNSIDIDCSFGKNGFNQNRPLNALTALKYDSIALLYGNAVERGCTLAQCQYPQGLSLSKNASLYSEPPPLESVKSSDLMKTLAPTVLQTEASADLSLILDPTVLEAVKSSDFSICIEPTALETTISADFSLFGEDKVSYVNRNYSESPSKDDETDENRSQDDFLAAIKSALDPIKASTVSTFFDTLYASMESMQLSNNDFNFDVTAQHENEGEFETLSSSMMSLCLSTDGNFIDIGHGSNLEPIKG